MFFLTFLCEGVLGAQWAFCLTPSDAFSGQIETSLVDQESCHFPAFKWATSMNSMSSSLPISPQEAATATSQSLWFLTMELVVEEMGLSRYHEGSYLHSVPSRNLDSRHGFLPLVKASKTHSSQLQQDIPMYCLETFPHKDCPNLTLISPSYLVSHVNMKGI